MFVGVKEWGGRVSVVEIQNDLINRRTVLQHAGVIALGSVALAGCSGDGDSGNDDEDNENGGNTDFGGWIEDAKNYNGTVADETGSD